MSNKIYQLSIVYIDSHAAVEFELTGTVTIKQLKVAADSLLNLGVDAKEVERATRRVITHWAAEGTGEGIA